MKKGNLKTATILLLLASLTMVIAPVYAKPKTTVGDLQTMTIVSGEGEIVTQFKARKMIWLDVVDIYSSSYYADLGSIPWIEIEGATWVTWDCMVEDPTENSWYIYKKTFDIPGTVVSAMMSITADNAYMAHLNGKLVSRDGNLYQPTPDTDPMNWQTVETFDVTKPLREGNNQIVVYVRNYGVTDSSWIRNPTGLVFSIDITYLG